MSNFVREGEFYMANVEVVKGDITKIEVDAVVNAANEQLAGGGGVDGAIHRAGGPAIMAECRKIGRCPTGEAVITTAGHLPAKKVIHTVGPVWRGGNRGERELLTGCYQKSLQLALEHELYTIAFPNISTGVYGYPKREAADVAIQAVNHFVERNERIKKVLFVCFDDENYQIYKEKLENMTSE